jgi:hypothetical protein
MAFQQAAGRCARCGRRLPANGTSGGAVAVNGAWFGPECVKHIWAVAGESDQQYVERKQAEGQGGSSNGNED